MSNIYSVLSPQAAEQARAYKAKRLLEQASLSAVVDDTFQCYGGIQEFFTCNAPETMVSGPYDVGKTFAALQRVNRLLSSHKNARGLMIRKTYKSLIQTAVVSFEEKVHKNQIGQPGYGVTKYGGEKPEWFDYSNGSRLVLGGLDNPQKTLSSEYDLIYVPQAEELTEDEWQALTRAASGRAGNMPFAQVMGDCNPDVPWHWILSRKRLTRFESRHEDNPTIFERDKNGRLTGNYTPGGKVRMEALDALTGVRYKRGRLGLWVAAEGQVYDTFDPAIHVIDRFPIPDNWPRYRSIDFGYTNPFSCSWWAADQDGRLYQYRQIYMTRRTVKAHAAQINALSQGEHIIATIADHDAEDRATLAENGIKTIAADKRISVGIEKVQHRLKPQGDGRPRIFFLRDSLVEVDPSLKNSYKPTNTIQEFAAYVWPPGVDGRPNKEVPIDDNNHGLDEARYMVMYFDGRVQRKAKSYQG